MTSFKDYPDQAALHETEEVMASVRKVMPDIATGDYNKLFTMVLEARSKPEPELEEKLVSPELQRAFDASRRGLDGKKY